MEPQKVVRALFCNKLNAVGIDCLTPRLVSLTLPCILSFITHIQLLSQYSVFPDVWKSALICPLPKVKCPKNLQHYRPISILCMLSKAMERVVAKRITEHLEVFDLFDPYQAAYKKGYSTQTALIKVTGCRSQEGDCCRIFLLYESL